MLCIVVYRVYRGHPQAVGPGWAQGKGPVYAEVAPVRWQEAWKAFVNVQCRRANHRPIHMSSIHDIRI